MHPNTTYRGLYLLACLATAGLLIHLGAAPPQPPSEPREAKSCDLNHGPCTQPLANGAATLEILPRPIRAMIDLTFRVTLAGLPAAGSADAGPPFIDLDMPDMFMGYNRVILTAERPGVYSGSGVIVRCPSGIPTWKATVTAPGVGEATFVFDVQY